MNEKDIYKKIVLGILFVFPLLVYLFFASGKNNFAKLPILTNEVNELPKTNNTETTMLKDHITIIGYWGGNLENKKSEALNLNEKIYKRFYKFKDFQFVFFVNPKLQNELNNLKNSLKKGVQTDLSRWIFIESGSKEIKSHFRSLKTPFSLDKENNSPYVFIIDKNLNLRGRNDDEETGTLYGFDARSVAELNKKMVDDVKVILAEYRLALKIYNNKLRN